MTALRPLSSARQRLHIGCRGCNDDRNEMMLYYCICCMHAFETLRKVSRGENTEGALVHDEVPLALVDPMRQPAPFEQQPVHIAETSKTAARVSAYE